VPSNAVGKFLKGEIGPSLGVTLQPVSLPGAAVAFLLLKVDAGSAAERASLMIGDVLVGAAGRRFASIDELHAAVDSSGETLDLQFLRGDRRATRSTAVRLRPSKAEAA
jgi:S1-C subfamily serine protease